VKRAGQQDLLCFGSIAWRAAASSVSAEALPRFVAAAVELPRWFELVSLQQRSTLTCVGTSHRACRDVTGDVHGYDSAITDRRHNDIPPPGQRRAWTVSTQHS